MTFTIPVALLLLLILPLVWWLGWPRVKFRRARDVASLLLRTLMLLCLIFALAGAQLVSAADRLAVVFLVDASDSVGQAGREAQLAYIREALAAMQPDDQAAIVAFGGNAVVERPMSSVREVSALRSTPNSGNTDLEEAIALGLALFPPDTARRMVILSDGVQTVGDGEAAAQRAAATGVEISYVPLERDAAPEVALTSFNAPSSVNAGQQFELSLTVEAEASTPATLTVFAGGQVVRREAVDLLAGENNYTLSLQAGEAGFRDFRAVVEPGGEDSFFQNNQLSAFSRVLGPPRILLVSRDGAETQYLVEALASTDVAVDVVSPSALPGAETGLAEYDSVVLANVPASALSNSRMTALQTYVRDLGGGLVVSGGPEAFAPGGYFQTPLEAALPVEMQIRDQQRLPQLTITYVIDRSGSMTVIGPSGVSNLELAKEAIIRSIDFLQPTDRAGVVSFDSDGYWIADVQPVLDRLALQTLVATLGSGGGTDILAGMRLAAEAMSADESQRKHIILLTDGGASEAGLVELTGTLFTENDVTTSVIAIGDARAAFLETMAAAGGGNYHAVEVVENIPTIFTQEAVLATRSYILEGDFTLGLASSSPILNGISALPALRGYVATTPRPTGQVVLTGGPPYNDPVLAQWQYGLGRAVAFTSDATARWASDWVSWDGFAQFWNQAVQWTITEGATQNIESQVVMQGETARVLVDGRTDAGDFLNGLLLNARIVSPEGDPDETLDIPLRQTAPGQYEGEFVPGSDGAYLVRLYGGDEGQPINQTVGWVMSYSPEYRVSPNQATTLLSDIAALTGGRSLLEVPAEAFAHTLQAQAAMNPIWPVLLLIALLLLPVDIAVRRLLVTRSDLVRARDALARRQVDTAEAARMATLKAAKARARQVTTEGAVGGTEAERAPASPLPSGTAAQLRARRAARTEAVEENMAESVSAPALKSTAPLSRPPTSIPAAKPNAPTPEPIAPLPPNDGNVAGALLKRRKREE